eukprot:scaffold58778_cov33-Tisochrysis_lutea.AAC.2
MRIGYVVHQVRAPCRHVSSGQHRGCHAGARCTPVPRGVHCNPYRKPLRQVRSKTLKASGVSEKYLKHSSRIVYYIHFLRAEGGAGTSAAHKGQTSE